MTRTTTPAVTRTPTRTDRRALPPLSRVSQVSGAYVVSPALSEALLRIPGGTNLLLEPAEVL